VRVRFAYPHTDSVRRALAREDAAITGERFGDEVELDVQLPEDRLDAIRQLLLDLTAGGARLERAQ
ncbi:MAG: DUF1949 domain-containing protein, partial [Candidatus Krumholzibacteria bacterium]|nr:DUF1949 domain-containing protein [Candidatus Krumholzibacteria bacterium]